jgi:hypothetical protein
VKKITFYFLFLVLLSAFADIRFSIGGGRILTLSPFELTSYILFVLAVFYLFVSYDKVIPDLKNKLPQKCLLFYCAWCSLVALFFIRDPKKIVFMDLKKLLPSVFVFLVISIAFHKKAEIKLLLKAWLAVGFVNSFLAISQFLTNGPYPIKLSDNALDKIDITGDVTGKLVTGFFNHPNQFAQIIIPYFVVLTLICFNQRKSFKSSFLMPFIFSVFFGFILFISKAKGAILWSLLGIALGASIVKWPRLRSIKFFVSTLFITILAINCFAIYFVDRLEISALRTLFCRIEFIIVSYNIFIDHPVHALLGGGINFWEEYSSIFATWDFFNAHNVYLNQILMYGLVGFVLLSIYVLVVIKGGFDHVSSAGAYSTSPYIGAVYALIGNYFFEPSFADPIQKYQLFFMLCLITAFSRKDPAAAQQ